jgi:Holliday junction DNA helicase RuvB
MDRRILETILRLGGAPVGLKTVAVTVGEDEGTIEEVYEPYLIQEGFIKRTPRGREATALAYKHFNLRRTPGGQPSLFP